ncbi:DUF4625 domain-containing protein [Mucilaginibacter pallidiroseus]|uniref:DUF4625 domain-containing protein n=1 Tax=Mucilaginibacter pallidiroseus TaxID=2599295 RepID=A0A563U5A9_9SPHI|nr:DUF4625 domain-containing protein [Mucilaginibacter pallidiroseus]TWR26519.1 DUF4625 domain-containing protein [Mucilaginibacter pallidiroseus]
MKTTKQLLSVLLIGTALLGACKKDKDAATPAPTITGLEVGAGNNKTAHPGNDLHVEAQISAPGNIRNVVLSIQPENGSGWQVNTTYTENLAGLKNAEFHEHIDVPGDAAQGKYHGHLTVTDENGQKTETEFDLNVTADPTLPSATGFEVGLNAAGNDLHAEASITAPNKIASITIEVHGAGWEKEVVYTDAAMVGQTTYNLHKHVDVTAAPKGHYHVHLKVIDQAGKQNEFEEHFDKP